MIGRRLILFAALAAALAALGGCRRDAAGPNIVLVAMDGLRADHVGAYGYEEKTTPFIDFLASKGTRFEHAYTTSPWTLPAYASLLSGTAPATHLLNDEAAHARADLASLPGLLQEAGYRTAAFVSNTKLRKDKGFAAGFDRYYYLPNASARSLSDRAAEWLAGHRGESFFLMLQYSDLQIPYAPPARFIRRHYPEDLEPHTAGPLDMIRLMRAADEAERESRLAAFRALYDAEIDAADEGLSLFTKRCRTLNSTATP
ncbi:MAG: sulfatase-like hydrolase/transferase [Deltaproteobacteria bacterium]|nr:sulfatase-like hydrolase/transferase [Deltaproteobacteria bacterium]